MRPLGYAAVLGAAAEGSERRLAVLHRVGLELTSVDLEPGYVQAVSTGSTSFVHVHLAAGVFGSHDRERSVEAVLAPFLASCAVLPILVGDFNCVTDPVDTGPTTAPRGAGRWRTWWPPSTLWMPILFSILCQPSPLEGEGWQARGWTEPTCRAV